MVPKVGWHHSKCQMHLTFRTSSVSGFLVFSVPNAKNLAFGTPDAPDANTLSVHLAWMKFANLFYYLTYFCYYL